MKKLIRITLFLDWLDFGIMFKVFKNTKHSNYLASIDTQFLWFNLYIELFKRKENFTSNYYKLK